MQKRVFVQEIFYVLLGAIVILGCLELLWPRMILSYINFNWLLMVWVVSGILVIMVKDEKSE